MRQACQDVVGAGARVCWARAWGGDMAGEDGGTAEGAGVAEALQPLTDAPAGRGRRQGQGGVTCGFALAGRGSR